MLFARDSLHAFDRWLSLVKQMDDLEARIPEALLNRLPHLVVRV